jgi:hypothetical protein
VTKIENPEVNEKEKNLCKYRKKIRASFSVLCNPMLSVKYAPLPPTRPRRRKNGLSDKWVLSFSWYMPRMRNAAPNLSTPRGGKATRGIVLTHVGPSKAVRTYCNLVFRFYSGWADHCPANGLDAMMHALHIRHFMFGGDLTSHSIESNGVWS